MPTDLVVNTPDQEYHYGPILGYLEEAIAYAKQHHPSWTSMVITIVNKD